MWNQYISFIIKYVVYHRSQLPAWPQLFLLKPMPMLIMAMVIFTNKPGLEHADLDSKEPVSDAVSQLTTLSANVKPKLNLITDTDMVVMDTDTVTDMVIGMKECGVETTTMNITTKIITATIHITMVGDMVMVTLESGSALTFKIL